MKIALTGGIACGKSLVARFLNESGVETIDADDIVHELLPDPAERRRLAAEVFADPEKRRALEAKLHPLVRERIERFFDSSIRRFVDCNESLEHLKIDSDNDQIPQSANAIEKSKIAIIPLLFETHWDAEYDIIACVASDRETQISRMTATRGYTREEAEARLAAQLPVAEKAARSHYVIENNGSVEELKLEVAKFVNYLHLHL